MRKISNKEAVKRIKDKGFELITEYISHEDPITLKCKCGKISVFEKAAATWGGRKKICKCNFKDLTGQKFGRLFVNGRHSERSSKNEPLWDCDCDCGNKRYLTTWDLTAKRYSSCGCYRNECTSSRMFKGHEEIRLSYFNKIKKGAEYRNINFDVTIEYIWSLFENQNRKCALTGKELRLERFYNDKMNQNASLDRIDSSKGYEVGNVQWVDKDINRFKNNYSQEGFLNMVKEIYEFKILGKEFEESVDKNQETK